ncbi:hypothetical protein B7R74_10570, partial [Yersinia pseudotuberculosis]
MKYSLIAISAKCFDKKLKQKRNNDIQILFQ